MEGSGGEIQTKRLGQISRVVEGNFYQPGFLGKNCPRLLSIFAPNAWFGLRLHYPPSLLQRLALDFLLVQFWRANFVLSIREYTSFIIVPRTLLFRIPILRLNHSKQSWTEPTRGGGTSKAFLRLQRYEPSVCQERSRLARRVRVL